MYPVFENLLNKMNKFLELEENKLFCTFTSIKETISIQQAEALKNNKDSYEAFNELTDILNKKYELNLTTDFPMFYLHGERTRILLDFKDYPENVNISYLYSPDTQTSLTLSNSLNHNNYYLNINMSCFKGVLLNYRSSNNSLVYHPTFPIKKEDLFNCILEHVGSSDLPDILLINFDIDLSNDERETSSFYRFVKKFNEDMCKKSHSNNLTHKNPRI